MASTAANPFDFALRVCESIAFSLHCLLGMTEPFTGCLSSALGDHGNLPSWFYPTAAFLLWVVAAANFCSNDAVILAAQFYIMAFHTGGVLYHRKLDHHPAAAVGPGTFVVLAFVVTCIRTSFWVAAGGLVGCAMVAVGLCRMILVTPPSGGDEGTSLLGEE